MNFMSFIAFHIISLFFVDFYRFSKILMYFTKIQSNLTTPYSIYRGDWNTIVQNSTGTAAATDPAKFFCGKSLAEWRELTKGDAHTAFVDESAGGGWGQNPRRLRSQKVLKSNPTLAYCSKT